jgi:hypothetical protein
MAEIDTPEAPAVAGQPPEPTEPEVQTQSGWIDEPDQPTEAPPDTPTEQPPASPLTPDQIMEQASERAFQKMASWQGRRDKDLFDNLGNLIDSRLRTTATPPPRPSTDPATMLENPDAWARNIVPRILDEEVSRRSNADQQFNTELIRHASAAMDGDALFTDQALGNAVVEEIQKNFGTVNRNIPPALAAQLLVNSALANVVRRQAQTRTNPLAGNTPVKGPMGTVTPPAPKPAKAKPVKLSEDARALAKRWNYSEDDIARVFGEQ